MEKMGGWAINEGEGGQLKKGGGQLQKKGAIGRDVGKGGRGNWIEKRGEGGG